jgi:hypothetical protein
VLKDKEKEEWLLAIAPGADSASAAAGPRLVTLVTGLDGLSVCPGLPVSAGLATVQ